MASESSNAYYRLVMILLLAISTVGSAFLWWADRAVYIPAVLSVLSLQCYAAQEPPLVSPE